MKVAILDDYQHVAMQLADWRSLPSNTTVDSFAENIADQNELVRRLQPYEVVIAMRERTRFPAQVIDALPNLRLVVSTGGRNPSIDAEACARRNIALCSAHGAASGQSSTAEVAWALVLALVKRIPQAHKAMHAGGWQETVITESLAGKTLGVLGLGRLGKYVARYGQAFGMNVIAWSPPHRRTRCGSLGASCIEGGAVRGVRCGVGAPGVECVHERHRRHCGNRCDEADGLPGQHVARSFD